MPRSPCSFGVSAWGPPFEPACHRRVVDVPPLLVVISHQAALSRLPSDPASGYRRGTRARLSRGRLVAPPHRRRPVIRLATVALVLLLGSRPLGVLQAHTDIHP